MKEQKKPNILDYIEELMNEGYSEEEACQMWEETFFPEYIVEEN